MNVPDFVDGLQVGVVVGVAIAAACARTAVYVARRRHAREVEAWAAREGVIRADGESHDALFDRCRDAAIMRHARRIADRSVDEALSRIVRNTIARAEWSTRSTPRGQA